VSILKRIAVVGTSGSGKTTVARRISEILDIPHVELDALYWRPRWVEAPEDEFKLAILEATKGDTWVTCGNYRFAREVLWDRVDTVVWLDMPFHTVFLRTMWRTIRRVVTREKLWGTNSEGITALIGKYSMPWFVIKTYSRRKREYPELFSREEYSHLNVVHLWSDAEVEKWLTSLGDELDLE
jgi:adenylate kinase family enzyme